MTILFIRVFICIMDEMYKYNLLDNRAKFYDILIEEKKIAKNNNKSIIMTDS